MRRPQIADSARAPLFGVLVLPALRGGFPAAVWVALGLLVVLAVVYYMRRGG